MMAIRTSSALIGVVVSLAACGGSDDDPVNADAGLANRIACPAAADVGGFAVILEESYTAVQGMVSNGVAPRLDPELIASVGSCQQLAPPELFCDPACDSGTTCDPAGQTCQADLSCA